MEKYKILIIEDEEIVADFISECIQEFGHKTLAVCSTGEEAISVAQAIKPDLVLSDINLKGEINGIETTKKILDLYDVPIMFITGNIGNDILESAKSVHPYGYLIKPFKITELRSLIDMGMIQFNIMSEIKIREAWLHTTLESIKEGLLTCDNNGEITFINSEAEKLLNCNQNSIISQHLNDTLKLFYNENDNPLPDIFQLLNDNALRSTSSFPLFLHINNGDKIPLAISANPIMNKNKEISGYVLVLRDVSESIKSKEKLQDSQIKLKNINKKLEESLNRSMQMSIDVEIAYEELNQMFNSVADGMRIIDKNFNILRSNNALNKMLNISEDSVTGLKCYEMYETPQCHTEECPLVLIMNSKKHVDREENFKNDKGDTIPCIISSTPFINHLGNSIGIVQNIKNIKERKSLELQLVQAQKLESIGQLAAGIAHEINTPTQYTRDNINFLKNSFESYNEIIKEYTCLLSKIKDSEQYQEIIQQITQKEQEINLEYLTEEIPEAILDSLEGIQRISQIVRAMKEFSHPGVKLIEAVNINNALQVTITVARNEWKYVAEIETNFDETIPEIEGKTNELNQVFLNLITNASHAITEFLKESQEEKGKITISTSSDENAIEIRIKDTGTGIPNEAADKIFNPFFTTKEVGKGTGQGLSICHNIIVNNHNGSITFENAPKNGTTFIIRLPINNKKGT